MKQLKGFILILFFVVGFVFVSPAATENKKMEIKRFSLIVGANNGGNDRVMLQYAVSDAKSVAKVLSDMGGISQTDQMILEDPTAEEIHTGLAIMRKRLAEARSKFSRVEMLFYYSGHSDEESLLLGEEKFSYQDLRKNIFDMPADVRIAILDSCASGAFTRIKGGKKKSPFLMDSAYNMKGYAFMTSSSFNEASQESDRLKGSYFTHYLTSGLRGAADMSGDKRVTLNEAYQYAFNETLAQTQKTMSGPQHPNNNINMTGTGDVIMTDIRKSSATLVLPKNITGRIFIHDHHDVLVIELNKPYGRSIQLGLDQGKYRIMNIIEGDIYETAVSLRNGESIELRPQALKERDKIKTISRGNRPGGKEDDREYTGPLRNTSFNFSFLAFPTPGYHSVHNFSLHILSSHCTVLDGFSLGWGIGFVDEDVYGAQVAGIGNTAGGDMRFAQVAGIFNWAGGNTVGVQSAGIFNYTGGFMNGLQVAGIANQCGAFNGIQSAGIWNVAREDWTFLQAAGIANLGFSNASGLQVAGIFNMTGREMRGFQISGITNISGRSIGGQIGLVNVSGEVSGVQIGLVNITDRIKGAQVGLINVCKDIDGIPFGMINVVANGRTQLSMWGDLMGPQMAIKHGTSRFYNLYTVGSRYRFNQWFAGLGFGLRFPTTGDSGFNMDALAKSYFSGNSNPYDNNPALHTAFRISYDVKVARGLSFFGGISYNYFNRFENYSIPMPDPIIAITFGRGPSGNDMHWIGMFAGIQVPIF